MTFLVTFSHISIKHDQVTSIRNVIGSMSPDVQLIIDNCWPFKLLRISHQSVYSPVYLTPKSGIKQLITLSLYNSISNPNTTVL